MGCVSAVESSSFSLLQHILLFSLRWLVLQIGIHPPIGFCVVIYTSSFVCCSTMAGKEILSKVKVCRLLPSWLVNYWFMHAFLGFWFIKDCSDDFEIRFIFQLDFKICLISGEFVCCVLPFLDPNRYFCECRRKSVWVHRIPTQEKGRVRCRSTSHMDIIWLRGNQLIRWKITCLRNSNKLATMNLGCLRCSMAI